MVQGHHVLLLMEEWGGGEGGGGLALVNHSGQSCYT